MTTYFGYPANGADPVGATPDNNTPIWIRNRGYTTGFTCPGSGSMAITELSAWLDTTNVLSNDYFRVAIYDTSNNLIAQGSAEVEVVEGPSWQGHLTQASITPNPTTLTGGNSYKLAYTKDNANITEYYITGSAGDFEYASTDLTGGFTDPLANSANTTAGRYCIRCGVTAVVTATIEQEGFRARKDDGSEAAATFLVEAQDVDFKAPVDTNLRIRWIVNTVDDVATTPFQLEFRKSGNSTWYKV
jgi:hypothetical protein